MLAGYSESGRLRRIPKNAALSESEIKAVLELAKATLLRDPMLIDLEVPINIGGDLHGQYKDLLKIFQMIGNPADNSFLFLGDYVDRGPNSIETILLLLCYKIKYPRRMYLLRGNHETTMVGRVYGFFDECKRRHSSKLWGYFQDCFDCMPVAAVIGKRIFCVHGGISPVLDNFDQIRELKRPIQADQSELLIDLLWSDPAKGLKGWDVNSRGVSFVFGGDVLKEFLEKHHLDLVCRAHQVVRDGFEFFAGRSLVTIFSATNYCGQFNNSGGVMRVDADMICSFAIMKPSVKLLDECLLTFASE